MLLGTTFHSGARELYVSLQRGELPRVPELLRKAGSKHLSRDARIKLRNAIWLMRANHWEDHEIVSVEEPLFMDLSASLPPVIGQADLVLKKNNTLLVVDHKTSKSFSDPDPAQLILYGEYLRREHKMPAIVGVFDQYRMVMDMAVIKKPAFRRAPVSVDRSLLKEVLSRYRNAWRKIQAFTRDKQPSPSVDCWKCNQFTGWY
jgi:hypothetical protein